jgi:hypothetical protein
MAAYKEEMRLNPPRGPDAVVCPISDESVQGCATDQEPVQGGVKDILKVVRMLEDAGVPCCMDSVVSRHFQGLYGYLPGSEQTSTAEVGVVVLKSSLLPAA